MPFRKILCPVDFSAPSREALKTAAGLAAADTTAELALMYVWESPARLAEATLMQGELLEHEREQAAAALNRWKAEAESLGAKSVAVMVLGGAPWKVIVDEVASHQGYDLLVMGTHGRTGIMRVLLGSVAERVARHADCPVLLVRSRAVH